MAVRPLELVYAVDERPPATRLAALGLQYAILIAVYLIIVVIVARKAGASPDITRNLVSLALVGAAVGTALQAYNGRAFGSGFLAPPVFSAIYLGPAILAAENGGLPAVAGMTIFAGMVEIALSRLLRSLRVVFQPSISGFTILVVGLQLGLIGVSHTLDVQGEATPQFQSHVAVAALTLMTCIGFAIWGVGVLRLICTLLGLAAGVVAGLLTGLIGQESFVGLNQAAWLAVPDPFFLSYSFEVSLLPAFLAASFAATLRAIGVITSCQRINDATWRQPDLANIRRGVLGDGLGCIAGGLLGAPGMSVGPSLVGVSSATGATSRAIAYAAAAFLLAFAFSPKFAAAIIGLPLEIAGALLVFTASFMITSGIQIMAARNLDVRACFAISIALLLGLSTQVEPQYFETLADPLRKLGSDMLTLSLTAAIGLTLVFRVGVRRKQVMVWRAADASLADFNAFLNKQGNVWKLAQGLADRCKATVAGMIEHLKQAHLIDEPVTITASYDGIDLLVELTYRGRPLILAAALKGQEKDNEEAPITVGLRSYIVGLQADRMAVAAHDTEIIVRLWFEA